MQCSLTTLVFPLQGHGAAAAGWGRQALFPNVQSSMQTVLAFLSRRIGPRHFVYKAATPALWSPPTFPVPTTLLLLSHDIKAPRLTSSCQPSDGDFEWFSDVSHIVPHNVDMCLADKLFLVDLVAETLTAIVAVITSKGTIQYCDFMCDIYSFIFSVIALTFLVLILLPTKFNLFLFLHPPLFSVNGRFITHLYLDKPCKLRLPSAMDLVQLIV